MYTTLILLLLVIYYCKEEKNCSKLTFIDLYKIKKKMEKQQVNKSNQNSLNLFKCIFISNFS